MLCLANTLFNSLPPHLQGVVADLTGARHYAVSYTPELAAAVAGCLDHCTASWRSQQRFQERLLPSARDTILAASNMVFNWFPTTPNNELQPPPGEILGRAMLLVVAVCRVAGVGPDDAATTVKYLVGTISKLALSAGCGFHVGAHLDAVYGALRAVCSFGFDVDSELYEWMRHRIVAVDYTSPIAAVLVIERTAALRLLPHLHSQWNEGRVEFEVMRGVAAQLYTIAGELRECGTDPECLAGAYELFKDVSEELEAARPEADSTAPPATCSPRSPKETPPVSAMELMLFLRKLEGRYQNELGCLAVALKEEALVTDALQAQFDRERDTMEALHSQLQRTLSDGKADGGSIEHLANLALQGAVTSAVCDP